MSFLLLQKRKVSTSSEEDDDLWNTSLAVHETPPGEAEEFLCPYFDGSKLILPPGYESYKKKMEKDDVPWVNSAPPMTTASDGTPLRRSSRSAKRKPMYIYSDDESSSGFEDTKLSSAIASGAPIPTCMFVNAGVTGGSGIDVNKDVFKSLPQTKGLPASVSKGEDDERLEFTIEINESTDEEYTDGTKPKKNILLPDDDDGNNLSNVNGLNKTTVDATEPDIKVKDDPIFLSDDEVISNDSAQNGKENEGSEELSPSNDGGSSFPSQEKALEHKKGDSDEDNEQKHEVTKDDLPKCISGESTASGVAKDESADVTEKNLSSTSDSNASVEEECSGTTLLQEMPKILNSNNSDKEYSMGDSEIKADRINSLQMNDRNDDACSEKTSKTASIGDSILGQDGDLDQNKENESMSGTKNTAVENDDERKLDVENEITSKDKSEELTTNFDKEEAMTASVSESKEMLKPEGSLHLGETEEGKSEEADSEKTEEFEPEAEHPLITKIKEKMKEYCSQRVQFVDILELSGNLAITADNEKPVCGSVSQAINKENSVTGKRLFPTKNMYVPQVNILYSRMFMWVPYMHFYRPFVLHIPQINKCLFLSVESPVPTVCVPQELSNLVQKLCKEKLQYNVELLIQGELHATIDGTLVSTICNFSFEPEEDDF